MARVINDLEGEKFGALVVIRKIPTPLEFIKLKSSVWECKCNCGNVINVTRANLLSGNTRSCGCLGRYSRYKNKKIFEIEEMLTSYRQTKVRAKLGDPESMLCIKKISSILSKLSNQEFKYVALRYFEGMPLKKICLLMNIDYNNSNRFTKSILEKIGEIYT